MMKGWSLTVSVTEIQSFAQCPKKFCLGLTGRIHKSTCLRGLFTIERDELTGRFVNFSGFVSQVTFFLTTVDIH